MERLPKNNYKIEKLYEEIMPKNELVKLEDIENSINIPHKLVVIGIMLGKIKGYYDGDPVSQDGDVMVDINEIQKWTDEEKEEADNLSKTFEEHIFHKYTIVWDGSKLNFLEHYGKVPINVAEDLVEYKGIPAVALKKAIKNNEINVYDNKIIEKELAIWIKKR